MGDLNFAIVIEKGGQTPEKKGSVTLSFVRC